MCDSGEGFNFESTHRPPHSPESTPKHTQDLDGRSVCAWGWGQSGTQSEEPHGAEVTEKLVVLVPTLDAQDGKQVCREVGLEHCFCFIWFKVHDNQAKTDGNSHAELQAEIQAQTEVFPPSKSVVPKHG